MSCGIASNATPSNRLTIRSLMLRIFGHTRSSHGFRLPEPDGASATVPRVDDATRADLKQLTAPHETVHANSEKVGSSTVLKLKADTDNLPTNASGGRGEARQTTSKFDQALRNAAWRKGKRPKSHPLIRPVGILHPARQSCPTGLYTVNGRAPR